MATFQFRLNVTAAFFPFLSYQGGATVISGQQDTYYRTPNAYSGETADKNLGIPQILFGENFLPVSYGFQSIGFNNVTPGFPSGLDEADQIVMFISPTGRRYHVNFNRANGNLWIYSPELGVWQLAWTFPAGGHSQLSVAFVKGRCFFYCRGVGALYEFGGFNSITNLFKILVILPLAIADMSIFQCIVGANNYLILVDVDQVVYTIPDSGYGTTPDFTPSLGPTGAATESPSVLRGKILWSLPTQDGYYLFTSTSIVAAYYSNNIRFPWTYRELERSAPITSLDAIAVDREGYPAYANTTGGILKIGKSQCTPMHPEATEFFGGARYEYYDWPSRSILTRDTASPINIGLSYVGGRWLVLSYGAQGEVFTHAIIWDELLKRWGKVALLHARVVEFFGIPSNDGSTGMGATYQDLLDATLTYQDLLDRGLTYADLGGAGFDGDPDLALQYRSLGFVAPSGVIQLVDFTLASTGDNISVIMIGRIQLTRNHRFKIVDVYTENLNEGNITLRSNLRILSTKDMRNAKKITSGYIKSAENSMVHHQFFGCEGWNHTLIYEGDFDLSTIVVRGTQTGTN